MTVIAWDGKTLAADKRGTVAGMAYSVTKIHRVRGHLVAFSGSGGHAAELLDWFERNGISQTYPKRSGDEDGAGMLVIDPKGRIFMYSAANSLPELIEAPFFARGAGRDYAMAAMHLGKSAREAVEVACVFDVGCGNGVDTLTL
jgi:ATP-dependent protease HslVU (ClpYQ) peptidase subunit